MIDRIEVATVINMLPVRVWLETNVPRLTVSDTLCSSESVLGKDLAWEHEPLPSNRREDFLARCRYASAREAFDTLLKYCDQDAFYAWQAECDRKVLAVVVSDFQEYLASFPPRPAPTDGRPLYAFEVLANVALEG